MATSDPLDGPWRCDVCGEVWSYPDHCQHYFWESRVYRGPIARKTVPVQGVAPYKVEDPDDGEADK